MRPVARPAIPAAYLAVQSASQAACLASQEAIPILDDYYFKTELPDAVLKEYARRRIVPAAAPTVVIDNTVTNLVLRAHLDAGLVSLSAAFAGYASERAVPLATLQANGVLAANVRAMLSAFINRLALVTGAGDKAIANAYPKARGGLIAGLGQYCSYCEMPLVANLAVEHMVPKTSFPAFGASWDNFLLACAACNSRKGDVPDFDVYNDGSGLDNVRTLALAPLRFPTDADYANFDGSYRYFMQPVDLWGSPFGDPLDDAALLIGAPYPTEALQPSVNGMIARMYTQAAGFNATDANIADLGTLGDVRGSVNAADIPSSLTACWGLASKFGTCTVKIRSNNVYGAELELIHTAVYVLKAPPSGKLTFTPPGGQETQLEILSSEVQRFLVEGSVPPEILRVGLGYNHLPTVALKRTNATGAASVYEATLVGTWRYKADWANRSIRIIATVDTALKLMMSSTLPSPMASDAQKQAYAKANNTLKILDLNDAKIVGQTPQVGVKRKARQRNREDSNNLVNRRIAWRTRTWFVARDSVNRAIAARALVVANPTPATLAEFTQVMNAIGATIRATGCWTVWRYIWQRLPNLPATASPDELAIDVKTQLGNRMGDATIFPGTR